MQDLSKARGEDDPYFRTSGSLTPLLESAIALEVEWEVVLQLAEALSHLHTEVTHCLTEVFQQEQTMLTIATGLEGKVTEALETYEKVD